MASAGKERMPQDGSASAHPPAALSRRYVAKRTRLLFIIVLIAFAVCIGQLVRIQLVEGPTLAREALKARTYQSTVEAKRGDIVDRNGNVLATSIESYDIIANQKFVRQFIHREVHDPSGKLVTDKHKLSNPRNKTVIVGTGAVEAARMMAPVLKMDRAELGGLLVGNSGYKVVAKKVDPRVWRKINKMKIDGIDGIPHYLREYPAGATAATIVGVTNDRNVGIAGIEREFNADLTGVPGSRKLEISPSGQIIPGGTDEDKPAKPGGTVRLTIDSDIQFQAQQVVDETAKRYEAQWASAVVMDVATGKVLAIADSGSDDPIKMRNKYSTIRCHAVEDPFEPGSTAKLITYANALQDKKITPLTPVESKAKETIVKGVEIKDSEDHEDRLLTASGALAHSSNTATVHIGSLIPAKEREAFMRKMGFGSKTGIELPAESPGLLTPAKYWDIRQNYTIMFGQGVAATLLQITDMTASIGNNGVRVAPRIVKSVTNPNGKTFVPKHPKPVRVMSPDTSATMLLMMEQVTQKGFTGYRARVPGYRTAGKTGTAELIATKTQPAGLALSFTGVLPAEDPKVAIAVAVYRPKSGGYGGSTAGPAFAKIGEQVMATLKVPPSTTQPKLYPEKAQ